MTTTTFDGGPAFPTTRTWEEYGPNDDGRYVTRSERVGGMSLRHYFAAKALPAVIAARVQDGNDLNQESIAEECFELADAMLSTGAKTNPMAIIEELTTALEELLTLAQIRTTPHEHVPGIAAACARAQALLNDVRIRTGEAS